MSGSDYFQVQELRVEVERLRARVAELESCVASLSARERERAYAVARSIELEARLALAGRVIDLTDAFMLEARSRTGEVLSAARAEWDRGEK